MPGTEAQANGVDWARWMRALGERVLRVREFLGLSQDQLARVACVSQGAVSRLENGRGVATPLLVVAKISGALNAALSVLEQERLSPEARLMVQEGMSLSATHAGLPGVGAAPDRTLEELLRLYHSLSEDQRRHLLSVVRSMAAALSDEAVGDAGGS